MIPKIKIIFTLGHNYYFKFSYHLFSNSSFPSSIRVSGIADDPSVSEFWLFLGLILPAVDELVLGRHPKK